MGVYGSLRPITSPGHSDFAQCVCGDSVLWSGAVRTWPHSDDRMRAMLIHERARAVSDNKYIGIYSNVNTTNNNKKYLYIYRSKIYKHINFGNVVKSFLFPVF